MRAKEIKVIEARLNELNVEQFHDMSLLARMGADPSVQQQNEQDPHPNFLGYPTPSSPTNPFPPIPPKVDEIPQTNSPKFGGHHLEEDNVNDKIVEETPTLKMVKKTRSRRNRYHGPTLKSSFVNFCLAKFSQMTHSEVVIANYLFDENNDPR